MKDLLVGGGVPGTIQIFLFPDPKVGSGVGNGSAEMVSNLSGFNEGLKCGLLMLR